MKPLRRILITNFTGRGVSNGVRDRLIGFNQLIAASLDQQFHQTQSRSLVAVRKTVVGNNSVNQCGCLLVDQPVVAMVPTSESGPYVVLAYNPWSAPVS